MSPTSAPSEAEATRSAPWAALREQRVDPGELQESGRHLAMLRLAGFEPEVGAERDGNERLEVWERSLFVGLFGDGWSRGVGLAVEHQQGRPAPLACEPLRADRCGGRGLTRTSPASASSSSRIVASLPAPPP